MSTRFEVGDEVALEPELEPLPSQTGRPSWAQRSRFARAASGTFLIRVTSRVIALPTAIVLARVLGTSAYGKYAYALAWAGILATPAGLGMDRFLVRTVSKYHAAHEYRLFHGILRWASTAVLRVSVGLTIIAALAGLLFVRPAFLESYWIGLLLVPLTALTLVRQAALQGLMHVELAFVPEQLLFPGLFIVLVLAVSLGGTRHFSSPTALILNVAAAVAAFGFGVVVLRKRIPQAVLRAKPLFDRRRWLRSALPFTAISIISIAGVPVGVILLGSLATAHDAGIFQLGTRLAAVPVFVLAAINAPLAPIASRLHTLGKMDQLQEVVTKTARASVLFSVPVVAIMYLFRYPLLHLAGGAFEATASVLGILLLAQLLNSATGPVGVVLLMTGHERVTAVGFFTGVLANLITTIALIPSLGAEGAAIGYLVGLSTWNLVLAVCTYRIVGVNATILPWPRYRAANK